MKWLLFTVKLIGFLLVIIIVFLLFSIELVEDISIEDETSYQQTINELKYWEFAINDDTSTQFMAGWAYENIMPNNISPMAGYRYRSAYESVHDSLYCRVFVFKKGNVQAAIIELDLLIFPPSVTAKLKEKLKGTTWGFNELYLTATHTHNGTGNWAKGLYGIFVSGGFDEGYVEKISDAIMNALHDAETTSLPSKVGFTALKLPQYVKNRLTEKGSENDNFKILKIQKENGAEAAIVSFTAHPTTISSRHLSISNDYPHYLINRLQQDSAIEMSAFIAGPMGSHAPEGQKGGEEDYFELTKEIGEGLALSVLEIWQDIPLTKPKSLGIDKVPLYFDDLHIRFLPKWRTRNWLFEAATGEQPTYLDVLQIDNLTMISTPCDLSGEIALEIEKRLSPEKQLMINNFNGAYIGYITPDKYYYEIAKPETMEMNWVGPNNGSIMQSIILNVLEKTQAIP